MRAALGLDEPPFGLASAIEHGKPPDTFLISSRDPLTLRLCAFAPLRSFLPTSGISARDPLPKELYMRSCPSPPGPHLPSQSLGVEGGKRFGGFRRVGGAGFAAQTTIEHGVIV
jgi:hypothetical protein